MQKKIKEIIKKTKCYQNLIAKRKYNNMNTTRGYKLSYDRICYNYGNKITQWKELTAMINISLSKGKRFQQWIDEEICVMTDDTCDGLSPNYELILNSSLISMKEKFAQNSATISRQNVEMLEIIIAYVKRVIVEYRKNNIDATNMERMLSNPAASLEEALQRIVFFSDLFWQSGQHHIGLGRLDKILDKYTKKMQKNEIKQLISDFFDALHNNYGYKSIELLGDTGQVIVLGGKEKDGIYFHNILTKCFLEVMYEKKIPDPKLLLRVSREMPDEILVLALKCISTGIGCPLLSNDDVVIPALIDFRYTNEDAHNYITSACWEPFSYGKSLGRGNLEQLNFAKAFTDMCLQEEFIKCKTEKDVLYLYKEQLTKELDDCLKRLYAHKWDKNPLMTLFTEGCIENDKDISEGGAVYSDYGFLTVGLANVVDSLININKIAFIEQQMSLREIREVISNGYVGRDELKKHLNQEHYFGTDKTIVYDLIKQITDVVKERCSYWKNEFCGNVKWGFSSFAYLSAGEKTLTTFDGRSAGMPLATHISAPMGVPFTELLIFSSKLSYLGHCCNGNVVDFFVSPNFITNNFEKIMIFIKTGIKIGFFQMQINVVSSKRLIAARKNPALYPDLIVRVWGFSAYFNDLPDVYKDLLIKRALESEQTA